jgi:hypothetical protein
MEAGLVRLVAKDRQYTYTCPICGDFVVKDADDRIVALLRSVGVVEDRPLKHPEMFDESAPPLTLDDLIDFHNEIEGL